MRLLYVVFELILFAMVLSVDSLITGFTYGINKIKVPFSSTRIIIFVCPLILAISTVFGSIIKPILSIWLINSASFIILFFLGAMRLLDNFANLLVKKYEDSIVEFSVFNLNLILKLYKNPECSDIDKSNVISEKEAFSMAFALSLDSVAAGFSVAIDNSALYLLSFILVFFVINTTAFIFGEYIGVRLSQKLCSKLSWAGGVVLIILAFFKLLNPHF